MNDTSFSRFLALCRSIACERAQEVLLRNLGRYLAEHHQDDAALIIQDNAQERVAMAIELFAKCESPIEQIIASVLPFCNDGYKEIGYSWLPEPEFGSVIYSQEEIGGYRLDFLIKCFCNGFVRMVAVECDGHDYHDRTKEQAARDKARDRKLASLGITVLRFTGSEIYRRPYQIQEEIEAILLHAIEDAMADAGTGPRRVHLVTSPAQERAV